jgi:YbbR domain-containing protein
MLTGLMLRWRRIATPFALALLSLIAAIVLWVAVTDAENPNKVAVFSGSIEVKPVNVPDGRAVASIRDPVVNLRISAPENTLKRLTAADFRAEVDLAGETNATSQQRVIGRVVSNRDVEIVEVEPAVVTVTLQQLTSKTVTVVPNLLGTVPQGFSVDRSKLEASPPQVKVSGAESLVQAVASVSADVNLTGLRVSLRQQYPLVAKDAQGGEVRGVKLDPDSAEIRVPLNQLEVSLTIPVAPSVQGNVLDGYNLAGLSSDPPAIQVSGPLDILQGLNTIQTEPIDLAGLKSDTSKTVRLRLPAGIQSPRDSVTVRLKVSPAQGETSMTLVPQMTNVPEGLKASLLIPNVTVRLAGDVPKLSTLNPSNVKVTVSLQGASEGVQVLKPSVSVPEGIQVRALDPDQITVSVQR